MVSILIVDDDDVVCISMSLALNGSEFDVVTAQSGAEALGILKAQEIDLVLLDIFMPDKDGLETISEIRCFNDSIKIIAMSGHTEGCFQPLEYAQKLGADAALAKPFSIGDLVEMIYSLTGD